MGGLSGSLPDWIVRLGTFLLGLYYAACCLLPVRKSVAMFTSYPDVADNSQAMFEYLRTLDRGLHCEWLVGSDFDPASHDLAGARLYKRASLSAIRATATAQYVFHTHGIYRFARKRRGQTIVNLWHGMPLKAIGAFDPNVPRLPIGDVAIATSDFFADKLAQAFMMPKRSILVTGQPRNDLLIRLAKKSEPNIILWMPTYRSSSTGDIREDSSFNSELMARILHNIDVKLEGQSIRFVLKLHPMDTMNELLADNFNNIEILRKGDPQPSVPELLASSMALISDYSSVVVDYAILDRPIGFFCPDKDDYVRGWIPGVADLFFKSGTMLPNLDALVSFIISPTEFTSRCLALVEHCDDKAAERIWLSVNS